MVYSLSLTLDVLIITCFGVSHFGFILELSLTLGVEGLYPSPSKGKFSAIFIQVRFLPISLSLLLGTYTVMWMLVDWSSPISPTDHLHFFLFSPLWATLIGWVLLLRYLCLDWSFPLLLLICGWISLVYFQLHHCVLQHTAQTFIAVLIVFIHSSPLFNKHLMTITSNYLSVTYLHFINVFSDVSFYFSFATYSSVPSLCLTPCLNSYTVDKTTTSPNPEGMTSYR